MEAVPTLSSAPTTVYPYPVATLPSEDKDQALLRSLAGLSGINRVVSECGAEHRDAVLEFVKEQEAENFAPAHVADVTDRVETWYRYVLPVTRSKILTY